jgi:Ca2+-binding EF-hand superfamily protein
MDKFEKVLNIDTSNSGEISDCRKVFKLIDKDNDGKGPIL